MIAEPDGDINVEYCGARRADRPAYLGTRRRQNQSYVEAAPGSVRTWELGSVSKMFCAVWLYGCAM